MRLGRNSAGGIPKGSDGAEAERHGSVARSHPAGARRMSRFIIFAIDVEPDGRKSIQGDRWDGVAITMRELAGLRCQLEEITRAPVHFNWFLRCDPQIERTWGRRDWVAEACPALLA